MMLVCTLIAMVKCNAIGGATGYATGFGGAWGTGTGLGGVPVGGVKGYSWSPFTGLVPFGFPILGR